MVVVHFGTEGQHSRPSMTNFQCWYWLSRNERGHLCHAMATVTGGSEPRPVENLPLREELAQQTHVEPDAIQDHAQGQL